MISALHLSPEMHAMAKMAKNRQPLAILNWMPKVAPWRLAILAKMAVFGEIGDFGKNHQRAGDMWQNIQIGCPEMHAMAKMAKNHQPLAI